MLNSNVFTTVDFNTFTLNATGYGWIVVDGWTKLGVRSAEDYVGAGSAPVNAERVYVKTAETGGTGTDPKLVVTFTLPVTGNYAYIM